MNEYDTEKVLGLPGYLPADEKLLWQAKPDLLSTARHVFHLDKVAIYFACLFAWGLSAGMAEGETLATVLTQSVWLVAGAFFTLGLLALLTWYTAKTTVYTLTSKRVVLRYGLALPMMVNIPFTSIAAADLKLFGDKTGDISLTVTGNKSLGYIFLWPHARRWHWFSPKPTLRSIPNAEELANVLSRSATPEIGRIAEPSLGTLTTPEAVPTSAAA